MRHLLAQSIPIKTLLAGIFLCVGLLACQATVSGDEQPQADVPAKYADIYARLNRRVPLNFDGASLDDVLGYLEKHLDGKIDLDKSVFTKANLDAVEIRLIAQEPVTIKAALRGMTRQFPLHSYNIAFTDNGVELLPPDQTAKRYVLQTHDLRFIPEYNTKFRQRLIEQTRREIAADDWKAENGPWVVPGTSVFTVDVYHRPEIQEKVFAFWQKSHGEFWPGPVAFGLLSGEKLTEEEIAERAKELRAEFPFESLAARLGHEEGIADGESPVLSPEAKQRLKERDERDSLVNNPKHVWMNIRRSSLVKLHSDEVQQFVAREGFGLTRMPSPGPSYLPVPQPPQLALPSAEIDPPQGEPIVRVPASEAEAGAATAGVPTSGDLTTLHGASEGAFVSPQRLGYAKDREHVAGFGAHAFDRLPRLVDSENWLHEPTEHWAVRRLELVSLLKHKTPRVYTSDELPRMEELGKAASRELDDFETDGLAKLHAGEDVVARASVNRIEMLGSLRAAKSCLECHSVDHGELLGAFSYTLVRDPLLETGN